MSKVFGKKGQAALEFLTTYGWAFMVILVMIGALAYFGVLNPQNLVRDQCLATAGVDCKGASVDVTNDVVDMSFTNNIGKAIQVNNLDVRYDNANILSAATCTAESPVGTDVTIGNAANNFIAPEDVVIFHCTSVSPVGAKEAGDKAKFTFTFDYQGMETGDFPHLASGTLTTTLR